MNHIQSPHMPCEDAYQKLTAKTLSRQSPISAHHPAVAHAVYNSKTTVTCPPKTDPTVCRLPPYILPPYHPMVTEGGENVNNLL